MTFVVHMTFPPQLTLEATKHVTDRFQLCNSYVSLASLTSDLLAKHIATFASGQKNYYF